MQALVDFEGAIQVGVVDESLPADGGARLFEVDAHDDQQVLVELIGGGLQAAGVVDGGLRVVNGARADNDQQTIVFTGDDAGDVESRLLYLVNQVWGQWLFGHDLFWGGQVVEGYDAAVRGRGGGFEGSWRGHLRSLFSG